MRLEPQENHVPRVDPGNEGIKRKNSKNWCTFILHLTVNSKKQRNNQPIINNFSIARYAGQGMRVNMSNWFNELFPK